MPDNAGPDSVMGKAADREMEIAEIRLLKKSCG